MSRECLKHLPLGTFKIYHIHASNKSEMRCIRRSLRKIRAVRAEELIASTMSRSSVVKEHSSDRAQRMNTYERTPPATAVCLALIVAAFVLFSANFEWPTSRIVREGFSISKRDILVYDVFPNIGAGYVIGLGAIAITRFIFPRSSIKVVLYVVSACAGLVALPFLMLSAAISGTPTIRDLGTIAMLFAVPLAIATWAVISSYRPKREAR